MMASFAVSNNARILELYLDNQLVASQLLTYSPNLMVTVKTTYDEDFKKISAGRILLYETIKHVFVYKLSKVIDFYTNANRAQRQWACEDRHSFSASFYKRPLGASLVKPFVKLKS